MRSIYDASVMYVHVRPAYELRRGFCTLVLYYYSTGLPEAQIHPPVSPTGRKMCVCVVIVELGCYGDQR